jgi:hypothetical protein
LSFQPQYSKWAADDFLDDTGAVYDNPGELEINNGVISLVPILFSGQFGSFDAPWDPVSSWNVVNSLDSYTDVASQFSIVTATGYLSDTSGSFGNSGNVSQLAFFTRTRTPATGTSGIWTGGEASCFVFDGASYGSSPFGNFTMELGVRSLPDQVTHDLYAGPSTGVSCHGIYIAGTSTWTFIEVHPNGLKVHGLTGAILPGDFSSSMRRIRIAKRAAMYIIADDGTSLYIPNSVQSLGAVGNKYYAIGAPPLYTGTASFSGRQFHDNARLYDRYGVTGIAGFEGTVLWDDIRIRFSDSVSKSTAGYSISWPTGEKTMYTAPWLPNRTVSRYAGAVVDSIPLTGGVITVTPQYLSPSGMSGDSAWANASTSLALTPHSSAQNYIDLSSVPVYQGLQNAIRFKVTANSSNSGPGHQIDQITVIGKAQDGLVDITPNWKLSTLPKNIYFAIDDNAYDAMIPSAHYQDEIYVHNELNLTGVSVNNYLPAPEANLLSGIVKSDNGGTHLVRIPDGKYGPAWRNFEYFTGFAGNLYSNTFSDVTTGNFVGNLLDAFVPVPTAGAFPTSATGIASVVFSVSQLLDLQGNFVNAQRCIVQGYCSPATGIVGFKTVGLTGTSTANTIGVYEGTISIPRGPGVTVSLFDGFNTHNYFLEGENYREAKKFAVSCPFTGSSVNTYVAFGAQPRTVLPTGVSPTQWGPWADEINKHDVDDFILYGLSGYLARSTYLQYVASSAVSRTNPLDATTASTAEYHPIRRDAVCFEGIFRPYGLLTGASEGILFQDLSSDNRGITVTINRTGEVKASVSLNTSAAALGFTGNAIWPVGPRSNGLVTTGFSGTIDITSTGFPIIWGELNHIGVYQDVRAIGDTYTATTQPAVANTGLHHGARTAKIYLEVNGRIAGSYDIGVDGYSNNIVAANSVNGVYPTVDTSVQCWPRIPIYATTGELRTGILGKTVVCDFDHVRFGIRSSVDAKTASSVFGNKSGPPTFVPWDGLKVIDPISGGFDHKQYAHIFRFDHPDSYAGWDDGFGIDHAIYPNYATAAQLTSRGIRTSRQLLAKDIGPKGRDALRIGPATNIQIPFSTYDERIFNGSGSCSLTLATVAVSSGAYMVDNASYPTHKNMGTWITGFPHEQTSSNSRLIMGGFFKFNNIPPSGVGEFMTFEENNSSTSYGNGSIYVGLAYNSALIYGTRRGGVEVYDGNLNSYTVGQFAGPFIETGVWYHIGLDAKLASGDGWMSLYLDGVQDSYNPVVLTLTGGIDRNHGRPIGYQGVLGNGVSTQAFKSQFVLGGEHLRDATQASYPYVDVSVSEFFVTFPVGDYTFDWSRVAATGVAISGHNDVAVKNTSTVIADVIGTGNGSQVFKYGVTTYPATSFSGAGEHLLWSTSNNGNDFENRQDFGVQLFDESIFNNAESYYATYDNDSVREKLGSIDSPIQLGVRVPPEGVNLALVSNKEWTSDSSTTTFDLSDNNYSNITNKLQGNIPLNGFNGSIEQGFSTETGLVSNDIRVSSVTLFNDEASQSYVGYFGHLIGGEEKAVYVQNSYDHTVVTGNSAAYHLNLQKIKNAITVKDADGTLLSFDEFPYEIVASPFRPTSPVDSLSGNFLGWGGDFNTTAANQNQSFTVVMMAAYQTIGKTVFINYPSRNYNDGTIILQDSEIYNPIPLMKRIDEPYVNGNLVAPTGTFSVGLDSQIKKYSLSLWNVHITGWIQ